MIKNILVPVDGSQYSHKAVNYAIDLAKKYLAKISLIHIIGRPIAFMTGLDPSLIIGMRKQFEDNGHRILASALVKVEKAGIEASTRLEHGNPADKIVHIAGEEGYDLIVIGSSGLGSVARFLLGSVSNKVSHHATCPVLIVK